MALLGTGNPASYGGSVLHVCFSMYKHLYDVSIPTQDLAPVALFYERPMATPFRIHTLLALVSCVGAVQIYKGRAVKPTQASSRAHQALC